MRRALIASALLLGAVAALGVADYAWVHRTPPPDDLGAVGDFALVERSGRTVRRDDLAGKVWVASFVFTRCMGPCPQVSGTMARLQGQLASEPDVVLVTFTVDPDHDQPDELKLYADKFGADPERWLFLTGERKKLYELIEKGFKLGVQRNEGPDATPGNAVTHSTRLVVVDRHGHIRGYFDGRQVDDQGGPVDDLPRLRQTVAALLRERP
jgi:cytochrome oxidase Cu insertion factor (SCO1/SenC/PrrC family)